MTKNEVFKISSNSPRGLIIILIIFFTSNSFAGAWLLEKDEWNYYSSLKISTYQNFANKNFAQFTKLNEHLIELMQEKRSISLHPGLTNEAKNNRTFLINKAIDEISKKIATIEFLGNVFRSYKNLQIEYGLKEFITIGSSFGTSEYLRYKEAANYDVYENFIRMKLYEKNGVVISLQPNFIINKIEKNNFSKNAELRLLVGQTKLLKNKKKFSNFELGFRTLKPQKQDAIIINYTQGIEFQNCWQILFGVGVERFIGVPRPAREVVKSKYSLAKKLYLKDHKILKNLTVEFGVFNDIVRFSKYSISGILLSINVSV